MYDFLKRFKRVAGTVHLEEQRKDAIRQTLEHFMRAHEATAGVSIRLASERSVWRYLRPTPVLAAVLILLLASGGVSLAAEGAVPGQLLYPVKIGVNERVETALAFTPQAKAQVASHHAQERLNEAAHLAATGRLSTSTAAQLAAQFQVQVNDVTENVAKLQEKGDDDTAESVLSDTQAQLQAQHSLFAGIEAQAGASTTASGTVLQQNISAALGAVVQARHTIELKSSGDNGGDQGRRTTAQRRLSDAQQVIKDASSLLESQGPGLGDDAAAAAQLRLENAQKMAAQAAVQLQAGDFRGAILSGSRARQAAASSRALLNAQLRLKEETGLSVRVATNTTDGDNGDDDAVTTAASSSVQVQTPEGQQQNGGDQGHGNDGGNGGSGDNGDSGKSGNDDGQSPITHTLQGVL